jgi:hypothetical protein
MRELRKFVLRTYHKHAYCLLKEKNRQKVIARPKRGSYHSPSRRGIALAPPRRDDEPTDRTTMKRERVRRVITDRTAGRQQSSTHDESSAGA